MDYETRLALRAVVSGLHYAGTIDQRHIAEITRALAEAVQKATDANDHGAAHRLAELREDIARDGQVKLPSHG